ncbi:SCO1431 family membrane protein [Streptomyces sp. NPDC006798]|uniref:SCO1431 family membrane protein n=1 Tax=Streptomyces sp. NPDC006798 TaxID=3155462 RepID=UPI0033C975DC
MTAAAASVPSPSAAPAARAGTGGPGDRADLLEQILGWTLVVLVAVLVTRLGLL